MHQLFQIRNITFCPLFLFLSFFISRFRLLIFFGRFWDVSVERFDVKFFAFISRIIATFHCFINETAGTLFIVDIRHRHAPISDRKFWIFFGGLSKRPLRFEIPESMQLSDALLDKLLCGRRIGRGGKNDLGHSGNDLGRLSGSGIEGFAVIAVPSQHGVIHW